MPVSIITDALYLGNFNRQNKLPDSLEYHRKRDEQLACAKQLGCTLTLEQSAIVEEMTDAIERCGEIIAADMYETGFRDGARFMMELLQADKG